MRCRPGCGCRVRLRWGRFSEFNSSRPCLRGSRAGRASVTLRFKSTLLRSAASMPFFTRLRRASHLSLLGQRNMAQRKATPMQRSPGILPYDFAKELRGWLTVHPCTGSQLARIPASHPAGFPTFLCRRIGAPGSAHRARQSEKQSQSPLGNCSCVAMHKDVRMPRTQDALDRPLDGCCRRRSTSPIHGVVAPASTQSSSAFGTFSRCAGEGSTRAKMKRAGVRFVLAAQDAQ